jgi:plasmid maintenance system antidote protein VapI
MGRSLIFASELEARAIGMGRISDAAIARTLGVTRQRVWAIRKRYGIPAPDADLRSRREKLLVELAPMSSVGDVARILQLPHTTVVGMGKRLGVTFKPSMTRGRPPRVREGDVVRAILEAKTHAAAARLLAVHPSTISQAVRKARLVERGLVPAAVRRPQLVVVSLPNDRKIP